MPKPRPPYPPAYWRKLVVVRAGRNPQELAQEFKCSAQNIPNRVDGRCRRGHA
jgi:hypothetical protein